MHKKTTALILSGILLGVAVGACGAFLFLSRHYADFIESQHALMGWEQMNVLHHLRSGKSEELLGRMEKAVPIWAPGIPALIRDTDNANSVLWAVQRYYEEHAIEVPPPLRPLLDSLPPRPPSTCPFNAPNE